MCNRISLSDFTGEERIAGVRCCDGLCYVKRAFLEVMLEKLEPTLIYDRSGRQTTVRD